VNVETARRHVHGKRQDGADGDQENADTNTHIVSFQ
jgi:hypothetical protein